jgi:hypothetical protein
MYGDGPLRPAANQVPDFLGYLQDHYLTWHEDNIKKLKQEGKLEPNEVVIPTLDAFMAYAREFLAKNPPANPIYLATGIGLRMANNDYVALARPQVEKPMRDEGVPVTIPQSIPGLHGITDTSSIPVMGNR